MFDKVVKRDGTIVEFNNEKILNAILRAGNATNEFGYDTAKNLTVRSVNIAHQMIKGIPSVEDLQDIVEEVLLTSPYRKTAKAYIIYREQHSNIRKLISKSNTDLMDNYLDKLDWQVKENSNMGFSLQGLNNYISSEISKVYWLNKIYPAQIRDAHTSGDLHIHDLGLLSVYCVGWDLQDLLVKGFLGVSGKVESRPAKHFRSALGQVVNFFYTLQGESAGAQAFSSFDTYLAPFIRFDNLSYKEVKQALQEAVFNLNVPTRVGFQTPFTNITLDLSCPSHIADNPVIIGGEPQKETYREFQAEMDIFNRAFLEVMCEGDAKGRVFTFPIPTYNITKEFDWDNPTIEVLWEATAKYGFAYFANFVNSDMSPDDARSMCCRLRIDNRELKKRGGGLFGANPLTGSVGVVTINLPRLGYISKSEEEFMARLSVLMDIARESLEIKRKILEKLTDQGLYPYAKHYLSGIKERFNSYWKNHFSTIGIVGMNEACMNMFGENISTENGRAFAGRVLDYMRNRMAQYQEETGSNYNLEATPAEGTSYRLARLDVDRFPDIKHANCNADPNATKPFYTNSTQLPVNFTDDIFETLDLQDDLQSKYTGGTVQHIFVGEKIDNPSTVKSLVRTICSKYRLPYFTLSPTFSVCPDCGYVAGEHQECPTCETDCDVYSRIVGYLRPVNQWNDGKREEFKIRKTFKVNESMAAENKTK
jgi:ribonucleoside-triphosphate reductase